MDPKSDNQDPYHQADILDQNFGLLPDLSSVSLDSLPGTQTALTVLDLPHEDQAGHQHSQPNASPAIQQWDIFKSAKSFLGLSPKISPKTFSDIRLYAGRDGSFRPAHR